MTRRSATSRTIRPLLFAMLALVAACQSVQTTAPGTVGIERKQAMSPLVSAQEIEQGAAQAYAKIIAEASAKNALNRNRAQVERVRQVATRLIAPTAVFRPDALGWKWEVNVLGSDEVNAWVMPGGKIAVYTGLLDKLSLTDAELAAVLGHEIAHALREHGREQASRAANEGLALGVLGAAAGIGDAGTSLAQMALDVTINLPHSREQETEADRIGVELAARAGYDPRAAISLWKKMESLGGSGTPKWLSTHPAPADRMADLAAYAEKVMPLYKRPG